MMQTIRGFNQHSSSHANRSPFLLLTPAPLNFKLSIIQLPYFSMLQLALIFFLAVVSPAFASGAYYAPCAESSGRSCPSSTNRTDFLLSMKKGGTNILSTSTYLYDFFLCEQYNYDCGYLPQSDSYINVANGVSLNITATELADITTLNSTENKIKPYIGAHGDSAKCGMLLFPLTLTPAESKQVLDGYMGVLATKVSTFYNADRNASSTQAWSAININIRTAVLQKFKSSPALIRNSTIWTNLVSNQYTEISKQLKQSYVSNDEQIDLHAAYLIDSVTQKCNKLQSVNFLVDQSGSIGSAGFQLALDFLKLYVNQTNDDLSIMSIHFYDNAYDQYITYGHDKAYFMSKIPIKPYRAAGTLTGQAINQTTDRILAAGFKNGLPKVMVILTDGVSYDSITEAARRARNSGIIPIAVGIGANIDTAQLLDIAQTPSNYIQINSYADLPKLVDFISNYFCKQILTININESYIGNFVRVPESPSYFRVVKSSDTEGQLYELEVSFQSDPVSHNHLAVESQIDPFPDEHTEYKNGESFQIYNESVLASSGLRSENQVVGAGFVPRKIYFIKPEHEVTYLVKKNQTSTMNVTISYVAVRGVDLGFNISLKVCKTLKCDEEIAYYRSLFYKKKDDSSSGLVIVVPQEQDLSIFIVIGSTLAVLACLCIFFILACRRFREQEQKKGRGKIKLNETLATEQNVEQNLVGENTKRRDKKGGEGEENRNRSSGSSRSDKQENLSQFS